MGTRIKRIRLSITAVVAIGTLSGCSLPNPGAARLVNGGIEFVTCEPVDTAELSVSIRALDGSDTWHDVWAAEGRAVLDETVIVIYGQAPEGLVVTQSPQAIDIASQEIALFVRSARGDDGASDQAAWISVDGSKLSETKWLDQNDNLQDEPCPKSK